MSEKCNYVCFDFIIGTPGQARRALKEDYARWLAEQAKAETDSPECTADPVRVEELEVSEVMS